MQDWFNVRNIKAVSLALLLFVYAILVLSASSVRYTETIHRITVGQSFDQTLFGSQLADSLAALGFLLLFMGLAFRSNLVKLSLTAIFAGGIALFVTGSDLLRAVGIATLPALVATLATVTVARRSRQRNESTSPLQRADIKRLIGAFLVIIVILEIGALARWTTYPFYPTEIYGDPSWRFAELESALFHSLGLLSPFLVVLIGFSFFYKWFILDVLKKIGRAIRGNNNLPSKTAPVSLERATTSHKDKTNSAQWEYSAGGAESEAPVVATYAPKSSSITVRNVHWMILSAALILAPLLAMYPHLTGINPEGSGVSTDEQYYVNWMSKLRADSSATWSDAIANAFTINNGDRPLTLLLILAISNLTGSPDLLVVRYLPVALAPLIVMANYLLLRYSLKSRDEIKIKVFASIGAIFAVFSPQIVVGEYAGFLANWIALVMVYFALYFLIRGWETNNRNHAIHSFGILFVLLLLIMLTHLYTWTHFLAVMLLFGGMSFVFARKSVAAPKIKILLLLIVVGTMFPMDYAKSSYFSTPAATASDSAIATNIMPQDTNTRWDRLFFTMSSYVGGFLSNPALLLLAVIWIVKADLSKGLERLLISMFFISALPIAVGSVEFQTRVLYNIPFQIPALLALYGAKFRSRTSLILLIAIVLSFATYAVSAMANLYLQLPEGYVLENQFLLP